MTRRLSKTPAAVVALLGALALATPVSAQTPGDAPGQVPGKPAAAPADAPATAAPSARPVSVALDAAMIAHLSGLKRIDGRPLDARQLQGRAVLVSFFASWCPPCNAEFEHMKLLQLNHAADGLTVVAINLFENFGGFKDDGARLARFLGRHQPVFSIVEGTDDTARLFGDVERIPTVFVFDRSGNPKLHFIHGRGSKKTNPGYDELSAAVRNALGISAAAAPTGRAGAPVL